jgi:hypothetical protein
MLFDAVPDTNLIDWFIFPGIISIRTSEVEAANLAV